MNETMKLVIQIVLLIPTVATIGAFWYLVFANIASGVMPKKPTDKELKEKTK